MKRRERCAPNRNPALDQAPEGQPKGLGQPRSRRIHNFRVRDKTTFVR